MLQQSGESHPQRGREHHVRRACLPAGYESTRLMESLQFRRTRLSSQGRGGRSLQDLHRQRGRHATNPPDYYSLEIIVLVS